MLFFLTLSSSHVESLDLSSLLEEATVVISAAFLQGSSTETRSIHRDKVYAEARVTHTGIAYWIVKIVKFHKSSRVEFYITMSCEDFK